MEAQPTGGAAQVELYQVRDSSEALQGMTAGCTHTGHVRLYSVSSSLAFFGLHQHRRALPAPSVERQGGYLERNYLVEYSNQALAFLNWSIGSRRRSAGVCIRAPACDPWGAA